MRPERLMRGNEISLDQRDLVALQREIVAGCGKESGCVRDGAGRAP